MIDLYEATQSKKLHGQFFTTTNPFGYSAFFDWFNAIPNIKNETLLEPFAGANNIVLMLRNLSVLNPWGCYDIDPKPELNEEEEIPPILKQDVLADFPKGFNVVITNPPYLAKNSATRSGLPFPQTDHDDLYKLCLDKMLSNAGYVAAIIPDSFITQNLFHNRLHSVISLTCVMFEDTDCPVCLALFVPENEKADPSDFKVYAEHKYIGQYSDLKRHLAIKKSGVAWKCNDKAGEIGLRAIDSQKGASIRFCVGEEIPAEDVTGSSRSITRIKSDLALTDKQVKALVAEANKLLNELREKTQDVTLTAFKGLRSDGKYRRRLDYKQAKALLDLSLDSLGLI